MKKTVGLLLMIALLSLSGIACADRDISLGGFGDSGWAVIFESVEPYKTVLVGYFNPEGQLMQGEWEFGVAFHEGRAGVELNGQYGFIDTTGELVIPYEWKNVKFFHEGLAAVLKDGKWGFIDTDGNLVIPYQWDYCSYGFCEGVAVVSNKGEGKYDVIDKEGNVSFSVVADYAQSYFSEGLLGIQRDGKYGFVDSTGELVIPCTWDNVNPFTAGVAKVKLGNSYFGINQKGETVISYKELMGCDNAWSFSDDLCRVQKDGLQGYIDRKGNLVIPCEWMDATEFIDGIDCVKKGALWGAIDQTGELVIPCKYRDVVRSEGYIAMIDNDVITILDSDLNETGQLSLVK